MGLVTSAPTAAPWPPLLPAPTALPEVPVLPPDLLPEPMRKWVADAAELMAVTPEMIAIPAVGAMSMLVARVGTICPNGGDDWVVIPNLWGGVVARPGALKSPTLNVGLSFLDPLIERARAESVAASANEAADRQVLDEQVKDVMRRLVIGLRATRNAAMTNVYKSTPRWPLRRNCWRTLT